MSERPNPAQSPQDSDPPPDVNEAEEILKVAGKFTEEASKAARQMSLAGLAAIWLFNVSLTDSFSLPKGLTLPTLLFIMALGLDFLYWAFGSLLWRLDYRFFQGGSGLKPWERRFRAVFLKIDRVGDAEVRTFAPTSLLFWGVLITSALGWLFLLAFLANRVLFSGS